MREGTNGSWDLDTMGEGIILKWRGSLCSLYGEEELMWGKGAFLHL